MSAYEIKCDDCKATIGRTDSMYESAAGGRCKGGCDLQAALRDLAASMDPRPEHVKAFDALAKQSRKG